MNKYDIIVIGSGGGTKLVTPPSKLGYKVAIVEKESLGGTCLNRGCIPSKMMIYPAEVAAFAREADKLQVHFPKPQVDFGDLVRRVSKTVDEESDSIFPQYEKNPNIDFFHGEAKFISNKVIEVNGTQLTADRIFIAVGTRPYIPDIPGLQSTPYMTSREALRNEKLPAKLIVIGGGFIGLELGFAYNALGSDVEFIVRSKMLSHLDPDITSEFEKAFIKNHKVHLNSLPEKVEYRDGLFLLHCKGPSGNFLVEGDALLVATGVMPNSDTLDLEKTDIQTDRDGYIRVNDFMQTNVPEVYALGDVIGRYFFRHSVNFEGEFLFKTLYVDKKPQPIAYPPVPEAVFTHPQVASVGLTEPQCQEMGLSYISAINPYSASAMGMARLSDHGMVKILVDTQSRKVLGAHIVGDEASNLIHVFILLITMGGTVDDLLSMIFIHPALPEIARNAARKAREKLASLEYSH